MQLARRTENGRMPEAYMVTKMRCGPDSGINPMRTARRIIIQTLPRIQVSMSIYMDRMPNRANTPKVQAKIVGR